MKERSLAERFIIKATIHRPSTGTIVTLEFFHDPITTFELILLVNEKFPFWTITGVIGVDDYED
tara:strand:- start:2705 stop:2896 length:192 start_codon:yes stop_codon:yes gene_type:complete